MHLHLANVNDVARSHKCIFKAICNDYRTHNRIIKLLSVKTFTQYFCVSSRIMQYG